MFRLQRNVDAKRGNFSKSERKFDLEFFCKFGIELRTFSPRRERTRGNFTENIFVRREEEREIGLRIFLSKEVKGRKEVK